MAQSFDAIVVGAGFAGMHTLIRLRQMGMTAQVIEKGSDVGGTWYWNRYPGARCDVPSLDYSVPWDPELDQQWYWSEKYSTQPEILTYASHLADRHDMRRDIRFDTTVTRATWDDARKLWSVETDRGDTFEGRFLISAAGALSEPNLPDIPGIRDFKGEFYHTGRWPKDTVELKSKRIAVLGTGSTGVQASTAIAKEADHLYVLQRTAQFSLPCKTPALTEEDHASLRARYPEHREWQRSSYAATSSTIDTPFGPNAFDDPEDVRFANYEKAWNNGTAALVGVYGDVSTNREVAQEVSDFVRDKIRQTIKDPAVAEKLCPRQGTYIGTRRIIIDTGYYEIFNQDNVTLVDIREDPIERITADGVKTRDNFYPLDMLVVATGYDAVTGPLIAMNITGKDGVKLADSWADGPHTYLGIMVAGFPNLFTITGPSSPGVLANVIFSIDQHVNWACDCIEHMRKTGAIEIDTTREAEDEWRSHAFETVEGSLRMQDENNWYLGTNVPGKPRAVLVYQGGLGFYRDRCNEIAQEDYRGFVFGYERETASA
jgi:cation diffusion facilitator CzcD-associated flavoprotein CzcO